MKSVYVFIQVVFLVFFFGVGLARPNSGFFLPDSVDEMTISYRSTGNLIVLPVVLNDSVTVNLILDTGCRNLVLFGRRFQKLFPAKQGKEVEFSGLGSGKPVLGYLTLNNKVTIRKVIGELIPVVIVPQRNLFSAYNDIDGVIGYDIFLKFEIELNPRSGTVTFRPASRAIPPAGYTQVPLNIVDSRPIMSSAIGLDSKADKDYDLMIDTGSTLGLLLKTTNIDDYFYSQGSGSVIGKGLNGTISGYSIIADRLLINTDLIIQSVPAAVIESRWHNHASIGMEILKDYILVLNYCKAYACFKLA